MVDINDVSDIGYLYQELNTIAAALQYLEEEEGRISSMTIVPASTSLSQRPVTVDTAGIAYPPQMVAGIKDQLNSRVDAIRARLGELGVTGAMPEGRQAQSQPQAKPQPPGRRGRK